MLGNFFTFLFFSKEKYQLPGFKLTSERVKRFRGYQLNHRGDRLVDAIILILIGRFKRVQMMVDPGTGGVLSCVLETETTARNQTQKQETETRDRKQETDNKSDREGTKKEGNNPRKNNPVEYSKHGKFHKGPITSVPIPETSQNIIFSSHKVTDMS